MSTAEQMHEQVMEERRKELLKRQYADFLRQWRPENREDSLHFEADLMMLMQSVQADAATHYNALATQLIAALPVMFNPALRENKERAR